VLPELLDAEQLSAQRSVTAAGCRLDAIPAAATPDGADGCVKNMQASLFSLAPANRRPH